MIFCDYMIMKKTFLSICMFFILYIPATAHDFDVDLMIHVLWNPDATWTEFREFIETGENELLQEAITDINQRVEIALEIPGKKYVALYVNENPDFTYSQIKELIGDDPMLTELWVENIYSFLSQAYSPQRDESFDFSFFLRTIWIWLMHILAGIDHILFLVTLIVCLPKTRRILWIITTFTIAHCLTLVLWGLWIISLPSVIVESMILISIILMWVYAIFSKVWETKNLYFETTLIFILWLFHGLWFAGFFSGVLETSENIIIPVLGFNIWVELGQIIIMIVITSLLFLLYKYLPKHKNTIKNSVMIWCIIIAGYWLLLSFV